MAVIAIDVGQSRARALLVEPGGEREIDAPGTALPLAGRGAAQRVGRRLARLAARISSSDPVEVVCIGLSGFDGPAAQAGPVAAAVAGATGAPRIVIANDVVPWYLAALASEPGVVAAVGTGAVTLASDGAEVWARADGCGHLLGDDGSGYWVGRAGLASALRAVDGRGGSSGLMERAVTRFGSAEAIGPGVYGASSPARAIAAFAREVADAARSGDPEALGIWEAAGRSLARSILGAWRRVFPAGEIVPVRLVGSLVHAGPMYIDPCREELRKYGLEPRLTDADPLRGALALSSESARRFRGLVVDWRASDQHA